MIDCRDTKPFIVQKFDDERLKTDEPILFTHDELNGVFGASFKLPLPSGSTVLVGFFSSNYLENIPLRKRNLCRSLLTLAKPDGNFIRRQNESRRSLSALQEGTLASRSCARALVSRTSYLYHL